MQILLTFEKRFYRQQFSLVVSLIASGSTFGDPVIDTTRTLMSNGFIIGFMDCPLSAKILLERSVSCLYSTPCAFTDK